MQRNVFRSSWGDPCVSASITARLKLIGFTLIYVYNNNLPQYSYLLKGTYISTNANKYMFPVCVCVGCVCTVLWIVHFSWASFASCCMRASHQSRNVNTSKTTNKCVWISVTSAELMRIRQYFVSLTDGVLAFHHMSLRLHTAPTRTRAVNILTYIFLATLCHTSPTHLLIHLS